MLSKLADGVYSLAYRSPGADLAIANGLAIVRDNSIMGSDEAGGLFNGRFCPGDPTTSATVSGRLCLPPDGELITGLRAGPDGMDIDLQATADPTEQGLRFHVQIADKTIDVDAAYIGPLPLPPTRTCSPAQ